MKSGFNLPWKSGVAQTWERPRIKHQRMTLEETLEGRLIVIFFSQQVVVGRQDSRPKRH